jgi:hypothetical protein
VAFELEQIKWYLDEFVNHGGSHLRPFCEYTWPYSLANAGWLFSLFKQAGRWMDSDDTWYPCWDLRTFDQGMVDKWTAILAMMAERNIEVTVSILDACSWWNAKDKRHNPLLQNIQHIGAESPNDRYIDLDGNEKRGEGLHLGGYFGGFGSEKDGQMWGFIENLAVKWVEMLNKSGVEYRVMPVNECFLPASEGGALNTRQQRDLALRDYLEAWIRTLRRLSVPEDRIVLSIAGDHDRASVTRALIDGYKDKAGNIVKFPQVVEQLHGPNSPETLSSWLTSNPASEMDGDGFDNNAKGYKNTYNYTMPSLEQCAAMRKILVDKQIRRYCFFNGYGEGKTWQDINSCKFDELAILAGKM